MVGLTLTIGMNQGYSLCDFCHKNSDARHICARQFIFKNIFEKFFMQILLEHHPQNEYEFWDIAMTIIEEQKLFKSSPDPRDVVYNNLLKFLEVYDCF